MDKTVKIRTYSDEVKNLASQGNLTEDQSKALELAKKGAQLEEERQKSLDHLKTIEQLRESLRQEQAKTAEMTKKAAGQGANELAVKDAQLEEEKSRSLENLKTIVQLRESLKQEQAKTAEMAKKTAELEAKIKDFSSSEANELANMTVQLEQEKVSSLEQLKTIEHLRDSLKQEQTKSAEMVKIATEQQAKMKEMPALEAKTKELSEALGKISVIAAALKAG